ncbi:uncharacterized protein LOC111697200 [Eurytemora carolleeae]|uniref:uncharacterized protein LOC111697200 n=1 Tax=Eurytemora carolleeae TaxID=1294199 RepID=UPI000C789412|nr:uncharacterized protein LOC111697200 [Eurytemora carolleeae]XP_023322875.1 uncharacterized protein LOC111697200 [Eurytemora carolleeae]XP_023322876.1 uncharacterized protein LOC111697200 [Eurytemora carolleeae]|eukprot:XP_023322874.1 uncharacterized protein LOC111697200 [Eurytemora affinis]
MIYILILLPTLYFLWPKRLTRIFSVLYAGLYPGEHLEKFDGVKLGFVPSSEDEKRDCFKEKRIFYILAQDETGKDCIDLQIFPEKNRSVFKLLLRQDGEEYSCSGTCQSTEEIISCGKLQVEILEPCRRTRVSFSGLMNQETEFVKFNFFFQVLNCPINLDLGWVQFGSAVGTILKGSEEKEFHFRGARGWSARNQDEVEIISTLGGRIVLLSQDGSALFYPGKYGTKLRRLQDDQYQDEESRIVSISRSLGKVHLDSEDTVKYSSNLSPPLLQEQVVKQEDEFDVKAEIVTFQDAECLQKHLVGGKGCSLGTLSQSGFSVPPGLVLTTTLSSKLCRENHVEISSALDNLERSGEQDSNILEEICNKVVNQITGSGVTESILENLEMVGNSVFGDIWSEKLAVRSSGVDEDGLDTSCAGQNETILGVHGKNPLLRSIEKCLASQYAYRSVLYRRQNGQPLVSNMAVVIQRMVPADSAGVLFTANPVTGNPLEYTVHLISLIQETL